MQAVIIIPARLEAKRFPRKLLADLGGLPIIVRVLKQAEKCKLAQRVVVATNSHEIADVIRRHDGDVYMSKHPHVSGTDRVAEAAQNMSADIIINLQGDEPFVQPSYLDRMIESLSEAEVCMVTLRSPIRHESDYQDENVVKVVCNDANRALYFSRAPIPFAKSHSSNLSQVFQHIGIYGFLQSTLDQFCQLPPHPCEEVERLEQLRALMAGIDIKVLKVDQSSRSIDTPADLVWAQEWIAKRRDCF